MPTNQASSFSSDIENYIQQKTMPLVRRQLVAYQFGDALELDQHRGTTYTASRYDRVNLPFGPLAEGSPPPGQLMPLAQVSCTAQQWGDRVTVTDVADLTIKHPLFKKAIELVAMQLSETLERNTFNVLMSGTQINYVGSVGSRAALISTSYLSSLEVNRATAIMQTIGAPRFDGDEREDMKIDAGRPSKASNKPTSMPHYVALIHPLAAGDLRTDTTINTAWSYSDVNRLYNYEVGEWGGIRFCMSNFVPYFTGVAAIQGTANIAGGSLATNNYYIQVTAAPATTSVEQRIYQVSNVIAVTGPTGRIDVALPNLAGYVFNVYIGTTASPVNLGVCASGPTYGPYAGQATQLAGNQTVQITNTGIAQVPPAAPATGVTVFPTFILGRNAYGIVKLDSPKFFYLNSADKSDPLNQLRVVGWKTFYGTLIENQNFFMRIESASRFSTSFG